MKFLPHKLPLFQDSFSFTFLLFLGNTHFFMTPFLLLTFHLVFLLDFFQTRQRRVRFRREHFSFLFLDSSIQSLNLANKICLTFASLVNFTYSRIRGFVLKWVTMDCSARCRHEFIFLLPRKQPDIHTTRIIYLSGIIMLIFYRL